MKYRGNILMILFTAITCLIMALLPILAPRMVISEFDFTLLVSIVLAALTTDTYMGRAEKGHYLLSSLLAGLCFSLLPWSAGLAEGMDVVRLFITGFLGYGVIAPLYQAILDRSDSGKTTVFAPAGNAFVLFLAAQGLVGMI